MQIKKDDRPNQAGTANKMQSMDFLATDEKCLERLVTDNYESDEDYGLHSAH